MLFSIVAALAASAATNALSLDAAPLMRRGQQGCPPAVKLPQSCDGSSPPSGVDSCCTNSPGGYMLLTQFWDTGDYSTGPDDSWTIHGLWPDNCDGSYDSYCNDYHGFDADSLRTALEENAPPALLKYMDTYWKDYQGDDADFQLHEWQKHGTCISTLNPSCYGPSYKEYEEVVDFFEVTTKLFSKLDTFKWLRKAGIVPSLNETYTLAQLQSVAITEFGYEIQWQCSGNTLNAAWYGFNTLGPINGGKFVPVGPDGAKGTCPDTGIVYPPKYVDLSDGSSDGGSSDGGSGSGSSDDGTVPAFFYVYANGEMPTEQSCLISRGTWYTTGTCATYHLSADPTAADTFTMSSSKGDCMITDAMELSCADGNTASTFSLDSDGNLSYDGSNAFYAPEVASGSTQVTVSTAEEAVPLRISYSAQ